MMRLRHLVAVFSAALLTLGAGCSGPDQHSQDDDAGTAGDAGGSDAETDAAACQAVTCERAMVCEPATGQCSCRGQVCGEGTRCDAELGACVVEDVEAVCQTGSGWSAGQPAFRNATSDWGLDDLAADGVRISVADIDGDGRADLAVRKTGSTPNDFAPGGQRTFWLLRNTGAGFEDVTQASGILASRLSTDPMVTRPAEVVVWADVDNDGDLDAYTGTNKGDDTTTDDTSEIMLNAGDGTFTFGAYQSAVRRADGPDHPSGASFVDVDRDGHVDLWVSQYGTGQHVALQDLLMMGDGTGSFALANDQLGISTADWPSGALTQADLDALNTARAHSRAWGTTACDMNNDGIPELMAASYGRAPNHLWLGGDQGGQLGYTNRSVASNYAFDAYTDWSDNQFARCHCKLHPTDPGCDGVGDPLIVCQSDADVRAWNHALDREPFRLGGNSGSTACADLDGDGWMDLVTSEIVHWWTGESSDPRQILRNTQNPEVVLERVPNADSGLQWQPTMQAWNNGDITNAVFDFDNDGRPDIYVGSTDYPGTRGHLFHQQADATFAEVSLEDGIDHKSSHGLGVADFDRDGDLDIVVGHSRFRCSSGDHCYPEGHARFFENVTGQQANFIQLELVGGPETNRAAIGARVTAVTDTGSQTHEVGGGYGHYGMQNDLVAHLGLGAACRAEVTVTWPDAERTTQRFVLPAGHRYRLVQGGVPEVVE